VFWEGAEGLEVVPHDVELVVLEVFGFDPPVGRGEFEAAEGVFFQVHAVGVVEADDELEVHL